MLLYLSESCQLTELLQLLMKYSKNNFVFILLFSVHLSCQEISECRSVPDLSGAPGENRPGGQAFNL